MILSKRKGGLFTSLRNEFWEYALVVYPNPNLSEIIRLEVQSIVPGLSLKQPQIEIAGFLIKEEMEPVLSRWIRNICMLHSQFHIILNNYSCIPPHTVYLRVQDAQSLKKLSAALGMLDGFIIANDCPPIQVVDKLQLVIASGLSQSSFEQVTRTFSSKTFHESFVAEKLVLVKKDNSGKCEIIDHFALAAAMAE